MARQKRAATSMSGLTHLRKQAHAMMKRLRQVGQRELTAIEHQISKLNKQREMLMHEIGAAVGQRQPHGRTNASPVRRGRRARVNWDSVLSRLPKGSFQASDVRKLVPGVAAGTLSQRLTGWVKAKKLKRTGTRRGTKYTRAA